MTEMFEYWYRQFLCHYGYYEDHVVRYGYSSDERELLIYLDDGDMMLYDPLEDTCRSIPKDSRSMTELECNKEFAARLRNAMRRNRCSQQQLAVRTGLTQSAISNYLTGRRMPSFYIIDKIAKALRCSVDEFRYL